jgi:hypothetical protein
MEKFALGALLGALGGALIVANNYKMRTLVKKSQQEVQDKINQIMDNKLRDMEMMETTEESSATENEKKKSKK